MEKIQKFTSGRVKAKKDDDVVDRLNYYWTSSILGIFAIGIIGKQYVGTPIQCWLPAEFKGPWEKYSESYCFVENTYFVRFNQTQFPNSQEHRSLEIHYYQWVPFLFVAQMFLFIAPKLVWRLFCRRDGLDVNNLIDLASSMAGVAAQEFRTAQAVRSHRTTINKLRHIQEPNVPSLLDIRTKRHSQHNSTFSFAYLGFKLACFVNTVAQLFILNKFLGPEYKLWGYGILKDLIEGREWYHSGHFPRVTFCDISIREMGNHFIHHTFQCVLMINMLNEKLFIFLWFWLAFLCVANLINIVKWGYVILFKSRSIKFIKDQLALRLDKGEAEEKAVKKFYEDFVCRDGVTVLRLMDINVEDSAGEILHELWKGYTDALKHEQKNKQEKKALKSKPDISPPLTIGQFDNNAFYNNGQMSYMQHLQHRHV